MRGGIFGFMVNALITTAVVLLTIFVLNRFTVTQGIVRAAFS